MGESVALVVALPHIDILDKLASLVDVHLFIYMANMGIYGMGRYHQLVCDVRCGVSSRDKLEDFAFAFRQREFVNDLIANNINLRWACRCADQVDNV